MIAIVDYGVGNLFSLKSSLDMIGAKAFVTGDAEEIKKAEKIILPGVGAFGDAAKKLKDTGLFDVIKEEAKNVSEPIEELLLMTFFLSVGLLVDLKFIWENLGFTAFRTRLY